MACKNFLTGMGIGLALGSAIGAAATSGKKPRKVVGRAIKTVGRIVDELGDAMGL